MRWQRSNAAFVQQALQCGYGFFGLGEAFFQCVDVALLLQQGCVKFVEIFFLKVLPLFQTG